MWKSMEFLRESRSLGWAGVVAALYLFWQVLEWVLSLFGLNIPSIVRLLRRWEMMESVLLVICTSCLLIILRTYFHWKKAKACPQTPVEFYENTVELRKHHSLKDQLDSAKEVWGWWHTGGDAMLGDDLDHSHLQRLILAHPRDSSLEFLGKSTGESMANIAGEIVGTTERAAGKVKWSPGLTSCSMLIGNPNSAGNGWIQLEPVIPNTARNNFPTFIIQESEAPEFFSTLRKMYENQWRGLPERPGVKEFETES